MNSTAILNIRKEFLGYRNNIGKVISDDCKFLQIRMTVISTIWRDAFINGDMDNGKINRNVLSIGGDDVSIAFDKYSSSTSIELKFCKILYEIHFQVWGPLPMKNNLFRMI